MTVLITVTETGREFAIEALTANEGISLDYATMTAMCIGQCPDAYLIFLEFARRESARSGPGEVSDITMAAHITQQRIREAADDIARLRLKAADAKGVLVELSPTRM